MSVVVTSMTGFARAEGRAEVPVAFSWAWEAKSVNSKGLDIRLRLPHGFDALEIAVRTATAPKAVNRQKILVPMLKPHRPKFSLPASPKRLKFWPRPGAKRALSWQVLWEVISIRLSGCVRKRLNSRCCSRRP